MGLDDIENEEVRELIEFTLNHGNGTNQQKLIGAIMRKILPMDEKQMIHLLAHLMETQTMFC